MLTLGRRQACCLVNRVLFGNAMGKQMTTTTLSDIPDDQRQTVVTDCESGIRRIVLNNVKKRNSLSYAMLGELEAVLSESAENKEVKVVILTHNGPVFSAGHDLKELQTSTGREFHEDVFKRCARVMNLVQDVPVPVIAEVKGVATAAGCQLVSTCDLAVASNTSTFSVPGVSIGLFCSTPAVALSRSVNRKQALKMLLTGDPIGAQEALQSGLLNEVVSEEELETATRQLAERIIRHSRMVIGLGKQGFYKQITKSRNDAYDIATDRMVCNLEYDDAQEGIEAFFQKRKPQWKSESS